MTATIVSISSRRREKARIKPAKTRTRRVARPQPFTLAHFKVWTRRLVLDNGKPWILEQFQEDFAEDLFAGRPENWLILPEGNAKTTLVSGLALYHCQHRKAASVAIAASSRDQAETLYKQAEGFVIRSPELHDVFECLPGYRIIRCAKNGGEIKIWAADAKTGDGIIPTLAICEELHRHKDLTLYRTWHGKLGKRSGQIVAISTAGEPYSEFEETRDRMRQAVAVRRTATFVRAVSAGHVLHEWAVPEGGDTDDLELVKKANPLKAMTKAKLAEKRSSPAYTAQHWNRMVCCRPTRAVSAAIQEIEWQSAASEERIAAGVPVSIGLDIGWKRDTTGIVPLWVRDPKFRLLGPATILTPPSDGTTLHPDVIKHALLEIHKRNPIRSVVMDEWEAEDIGAWIASEIRCIVEKRSQNDAQAAVDYEQFMKALRTRELWHSNDPGLTRHAMNTASRMLSSGKTRFDRLSQARRGAQQQRVQPNDALIAAAMVNAAAAAPAAQRWTVL